MDVSFVALAPACKKKEVIRLTTVNLRPNESQDQLLKRFRKKVAKSGILSTVRRKRWFVSKSELRRIQKKGNRRFKRKQRPDME
jgi:small subunit ribosomal protein S21